MKSNISLTGKDGKGSCFVCKIPFINCIESDLNVVGELSDVAIEECCRTILIVDDVNFKLTVLKRMYQNYVN